MSSVHPSSLLLQRSSPDRMPSFVKNPSDETQKCLTAEKTFELKNIDSVSLRVVRYRHTRSCI